MATKQANVGEGYRVYRHRRRMSDRDLVWRFAAVFIPTALLMGSLASLLVLSLD